MLEDFERAPIAIGLRETLRLLKVATLEPQALTPQHVRAALDVGVSRQAVKEAFDVLYLFSIYDRLADTLGWQVLAPQGFAAVGKRLAKRGYL